MKLRLDALTQADCERVRAWRNQDPSGLRTPFLLTREMQEDFYRRVVCDRLSGHRYWAVVNDDLPRSPEDHGDQLVAMVGLTNIAWENGTTEIALQVDPAHQRQGVGAGAVALALEQAFDRMRCETVWGEVYTNNPAGFAFWQTIAAEYKAYTTTLPARKFWSGSFHVALYFSISARDWRRCKEAR